MSDEYKDQYIIIALLKTPPRYYRQYNTTVSSFTELNKREIGSHMTKDLPNTYSRSTAETAMNPIGQTIPVIHLHLEGESEKRINNQDKKMTLFYPCTPTRPGCIHRRVCTGQAG